MALGHGAAGKPGAAALAASAAPDSACICRTYACSIRRCAPSPLGRGPRRPDRSGLSYRGEAGWVLASVACCPTAPVITLAKPAAYHRSARASAGRSPMVSPGLRWQGVAGAMEVAGVFAGVRLERTSYPEETETRRASPLARRLTLNQADCGQVI